MHRTRIAAVSAALVIASGISPAAAQSAPATDIYLAPLTMRDGRAVIGAPVNITHRPGYDNQPSFTPDGGAILYTSTREDGQSDIYRYDLASQRIDRLTRTSESEYSATVMPGGKRFSVIRVEKDSMQRLWSFALDGSDPRIVIETLAPVGYHAWIDANDLALFVLGRPNALVHANLTTGKSDTLARGVGRSLLPLPDQRGFSFVRQTDSASMVVAATWPGFATRDLVALPRGTQDVAWLSNDALIAGSGSQLLFWRAGASGWTSLGDFATQGLRAITRIAISPDGKWIAIVSG
jgi:dipeptidyl aminopeptidase/acylaminoacyl peptidase